MHGTNDAAVITGSSTAELTETNAAQSTGGDPTPPMSTALPPSRHKTNRGTGSNGYGKFTIAADGTLTYVMDKQRTTTRVCRRPGLHRIPHRRHRRRHTTRCWTVTTHGTNDAPTLNITQSGTTTFTELSGPGYAANDVTLLSAANIVRSG